MTITEATRICMTSKYATFSGRARRREFWLFTLALFIASIVFAVVDSVVFGTSFSGYGPLSVLFSLVTFVPSLAVTVRRLHDTGRSGWWLLLVLVILIGWIVLLVFNVQDSKPGPNHYGPNPKDSYL